MTTSLSHFFQVIPGLYHENLQFYMVMLCIWTQNYQAAIALQVKNNVSLFFIFMFTVLRGSGDVSPAGPGMWTAQRADSKGEANQNP